MIGCHRPENKPVFDMHDSTGLRYLFQLRLGLSPLRSHKNVTALKMPHQTNVSVALA